MQVVACVPCDLDLEPLIERGISDYYFGHTPVFWNRSYSSVNSINRRYQPASQIGSLSAIERLLKKKWSKPVRFFLALNNHLYTDGQIKKILFYFKGIFESGLAGVICADIGLFIALRDKFAYLRIHASLGAPCLNSGSVGFFKDLGASRVILDRTLTVDEAASIRKENSDIELEMFALQQGCPHAEGICSNNHDSNSICMSKLQGYLFSKPITTDSMDPLLRLHLLSNIGIDFVKIPRLAWRGAKAVEMLEMYDDLLSFLNMLNSFTMPYIE